MAKARTRTRIATRKNGKDSEGLYFPTESSKVETFSSGCMLLDCVLGGGWALRRISNIIGDSSTGKTLLAIEACANFVLRYPDSDIRYGESESAFDEGYAGTLGLPLERLVKPPPKKKGEEPKDRLDTVEEFEEDFNYFLHRAKKLNRPLLYILDSLDALSDVAEMERSLSDPSYGTQKAKQMSQLFRKLKGKISDSCAHLMIVSQIRDKIGVTFGKKTSESGGRALKFYASQRVELSQIRRLTKEVRGEKRAVGVLVEAECIKNKIGVPYRRARFPIIFHYGIADQEASLDWLKSVGRLSELGVTKPAEFLRKLDKCSSAEEYTTLLMKLSSTVKRAWDEIETKFAPTRTKYGHLQAEAAARQGKRRVQ